MGSELAGLGWLLAAAALGAAAGLGWLVRVRSGALAAAETAHGEAVRERDDPFEDYGSGRRR